MRRQRAAPGQALVLRVLLQPNEARGGGAAWRATEVVRHAAAAYDTVISLDSAGARLRTKLVRK